MNRKMMCALGAVALLVPSAAGAQDIAFPNAQSKALADCVVLSTTGRDRLVMIRWIAVGIGSADSMKDAIIVKTGAKEAADRGMAAIFTRLFTVDCRKEAAPLLKANDENGVRAAFGQLGRMAMSELMNDPLVGASLGAFVQYADMEAVNAVAKDSEQP